MILVDANLLVYAATARSPFHETARTWLEDRLNGHERVGFAWPSLLAFCRVLGNPRVTRPARPPAEAWQTVEAWLSAGPAWIPTPTERHRELLAGLLPHVGRPEVVHDAHLAALALEHGLVICSNDGDFARFPGVRWENPLVA